jgi:hypothetical protein
VTVRWNLSYRRSKAPPALIQTHVQMLEFVDIEARMSALEKKEQKS